MMQPASHPGTNPGLVERGMTALKQKHLTQAGISDEGRESWLTQQAAANTADGSRVIGQGLEVLDLSGCELLSNHGVVVSLGCCFASAYLFLLYSYHISS